MRFFSRLNPVTGIKDFWSEFTRPNPHRWPALIGAMVITGTLFFAFTREKTYIPPASPDVTYITSYAPDRTDTEIVASNIANQKRKDALAARIAEREELRKELYRSLGRATGLDVDQMEAEIQAERALEEAEAQRAQTQGAQAPGAQALPTNTSDSGSTVANQPE